VKIRRKQIMQVTLPMLYIDTRPFVRLCFALAERDMRAAAALTRASSASVMMTTIAAPPPSNVTPPILARARFASDSTQRVHLTGAKKVKRLCPQVALR
jgi:hypothetical protein